MKKFALSFGFLVAFATGVSADDCDANRASLNTFDAVYCDNKVFVAEDARLNKNYGDLRKRLSKSERRLLLNGQRRWIEYRNNQCTGRDARWGDVVYSTCARNVTRDRANWLRNRITECESVGCAISRLSDLD